MRISDWSSDVCSADLAQMADDADGEMPRRRLERGERGRQGRGGLMDDPELVAETDGDVVAHQVVQADQQVGAIHRAMRRRGVAFLKPVDVRAGEAEDQRPVGITLAEVAHRVRAPPGVDRHHEVGRCAVVMPRHRHAMVEVRSEEHTSELQSLMRTSYAVFCLQKTISYTSKRCITITANPMR